MRIATWNVNGLRARHDFVLDWLGTRMPDVVGLQELKLTDEKFPHEAFEQAGYRAVTHGQKAWNGVAILSREKLEVRQIGLPAQEEMGARLLSAEVGGISFTTIYCPNGKNVDHDDFPRKLAWLDDLARHFAERHDPDDPAVMCGDFNVCPSALDTWNEERLRGTIFHTEKERAAYRRLLDWGFVDLFRDKHPDLQAFSWWDYRGGSFHRGQGLRIDFLLGTAAIVERFRNVEIDRDYRKKREGRTPSDHAPVFIDLE